MRLYSKLFGSTMFTPPSLCGIEGEGEPAGGGGTGATGAAGNEPAKETTVLGEAVAAGDGTKDDKNSNDDKSKGTIPANETPEQKTAREAAEKTAKDTVTAATLKSFDEKLKLPDGLAKDHPVALEFLKDAAERGMSVEDTQAMVTRMGPKLVAELNKPYDAWADMQKGWTEALPKDAEFGGEKYKENLGIAAYAMDSVFSATDKDGKTISGRDTTEGKAFREMLVFTGAGNHPEMVRMLYRFGKMMKEGAPIMGKPRVDQTPLAQKMYPTMPA